MVRALILILALGLAFAAAPGRAGAQDGFAAEVSERLIEITSDFRGARLTIFGVAPQRRQGDLVVVLRGPSEQVTVKRKRQVAGLWINSDPVTFKNVPTFFAAFSAEPLAQIAPARAFWELGLDPTVGSPVEGATPADADRAAYRAALVRLKRDRRLYQENPRGLEVYESGLFKAQIALPANAPPGRYTMDVYLFRNQRLIASESSSIDISRVGLERAVHDLAMRFPVVYGLAMVALALGAGWGAAIMLRRA